MGHCRLRVKEAGAVSKRALAYSESCEKARGKETPCQLRLATSHVATTKAINVLRPVTLSVKSAWFVHLFSNTCKTRLRK